MITALAALLLGSTTLWVLAPILGWTRPEEPVGDDAGQEDLLEERRQTLAAIRDLDMEFQVGKLTREDYLETRERLAREAVEVLKRAEGSEGPAPPAPGAESGPDGR